MAAIQATPLSHQSRVTSHYTKEEGMNDEMLNMSIRKFLKTVGVNSQLAIEKAVQKAVAEGKLKGNEAFPAAMTLSVGKLNIEVKFDGEIRLE
jgi:hypothetical protein